MGDLDLVQFPGIAFADSYLGLNIGQRKISRSNGGAIDI